MESPKPLWVLGLVLLMSLAGELGIAKVEGKGEGFEYLHQQAVRGTFLDVPLREVFMQLHQELGINYVVAEEELNTPVSFVVLGEPLVDALSKILAHWDYVLQRDQKGAVIRIFVVKREATHSLIHGVPLNVSGSSVPQNLSKGQPQPSEPSKLADGEWTLTEGDDAVMASQPDDFSLSNDLTEGPGVASNPYARFSLDPGSTVLLEHIPPSDIPVPPPLPDSSLLSPEMAPEAINAPPMVLSWP